MQAGFPFKRQITDRGHSLNLGGDYRYKYDLCPRARTVVVTDMAEDVGVFTSLQIASTSRVATIALNAASTYHSIFYRSFAKEVWACALDRITIIDANPLSATFNTVVNTYITTVFNSGSFCARYIEKYDAAIAPNSWVNCKTGTSGFTFSGFRSGLNHAGQNWIYQSNYPNIFQNSEEYPVGQVNGEIFSIWPTTINSPVKPIDSTFARSHVFKINDFYYCAADSTIRRLNTIGQSSAVVTSPNTLSGFGITAGFDPLSKRMLLGAALGTRVVIVNILPTFQYSTDLTATLASIRSVNENSNKAITYSPYSQKLYIRAGRNDGVNTTGLNRYHIIDLLNGSIVCGYREVDEGATIGQTYTHGLTCFNGLHNSEYYV